MVRLVARKRGDPGRRSVAARERRHSACANPALVRALALRDVDEARAFLHAADLRLLSDRKPSVGPGHRTWEQVSSSRHSRTAGCKGVGKRGPLLTRTASTASAGSVCSRDRDRTAQSDPLQTSNARLLSSQEIGNPRLGQEIHQLAFLGHASP